MNEKRSELSRTQKILVFVIVGFSVFFCIVCVALTVYASILMENFHEMMARKAQLTNDPRLLDALANSRVRLNIFYAFIVGAVIFTPIASYCFWKKIQSKISSRNP